MVVARKKKLHKLACLKTHSLTFTHRPEARSPFLNLSSKLTSAFLTKRFSFEIPPKLNKYWVNSLFPRIEDEITQIHLIDF
jgi:hypothetical protein